MSKLEMQQCVLGQVFTNCYFLKNKKTGELLIVDPGDYAEKVFQKVALMQGKPVGILLTHGHFDHIMDTFYHNATLALGNVQFLL